MLTARTRLTPRTVERRTVHKPLTAYHRAAARAAFAFAPIGIQGSVEVARLAVDVDIQRIERGAALAECLAHHFCGGVQDGDQLAAAQRGGHPGAMNLGP